MPGSARQGDDDAMRLRRCIRDLAALSVLPSMCVGRTPDEVIEIALDALPTALNCPLVYLTFPHAITRERCTWRGSAPSEPQLALLREAAAADGDGAGEIVVPDIGRLSYLAADLPVGHAHGRLLAARLTPLDPETDRVLVRSAANIVGTTLEAANVLDLAKRKDEFLAMLGHELRNPLAPILTAVELLGRRSEGARERVVIERHTRHLARLVDDLLDISRISRGHIELRDEQVTLSTVLEGAVEIAAPLISRFEHTLRVGDASDIVLRGDSVRLAQIVGNLLTNAAKFTPQHGTIEVRIAREPGRVRIAVRDTGRGLERDQLERIFEPFVQVDATHDALRGGLGLGLAIVRSLASRHGGSIAAESEGPGRGSTFTVVLPTVAATAPLADELPVVDAGRRAGIRVLVVDDNVDIAELLAEALQAEGFETAVEHDAHAALARWSDFAPHAAVLDVGMPDIDGYELARRLRREHGLRPTLIAATGYGQREDRARSAEAGFDCHFVKPVSVQELVRALDQRLVPTASFA